MAIPRSDRAPSYSLEPRADSLHYGFTLVELLVTITIIGMLAGIALGALYSARESARVAKTQSTITKLDRIVQARYDEFASRRVPIKLGSMPGDRRRISAKAAAEFRLRAIRYIMKMEMPDRIEDIANPKPDSVSPFRMQDIDFPHDITVVPASGPPGWTRSITRTALARSMYRRIATNPPSSDYDYAEIFYLWVTTGDREAVELFQPDEIGDIDGDGYSEFVDAWGMPIKCIRWPVGFVGESELMSGDEEDDHDPFDPRRIDGTAFRTVPLIWSNGPDKISGIAAESDAYKWDEIYLRDGGAPITPSHPTHSDEAGHHYDNITNHSLGMN